MSQRPENPQSPESIDVSRRRFTRVGAAAPVVLGSLVSGPVLATTPTQPRPPYHCTVSGKLSGNNSPTRTDRLYDCKKLGRGPKWWKNRPGTFPTGCTSTTQVNGYKGFSSRCWRNSSGTVVCMSSCPTGGRAATMMELLSSTGSGDVAFMRDAAAALLSADYTALKPYYPLDAELAVKLFNDGMNGTFLDPVSGKTWTKAGVVSYLAGLYDPNLT